MKKILLLVSILLVLCITAIYVFMPEKLVISSVTTFRANREGVYRFLAADSNWKKWWPGGAHKAGPNSLSLTYAGCHFDISEMLYDAIRLNVVEAGYSSPGLLQLVSFTNDSMRVELSSELTGRSNPFSRVWTYFRSRRIKNAFDDIVSSLAKYTTEIKNVYGINVKNEKVQYQNLISANQSFSHYPTTEDVYAMIGRLRNYINQSGAKELFSPMLNIKKTDSTGYMAQVGVPVDRPVPEKADISSKWMMKGGNILVAEVTGGQKEIEVAQKEMELYIRDYQRSIIAIPFQMLITDRSEQPDSTKWVTRIYYPVV